MNVISVKRASAIIRRADSYSPLGDFTISNVSMTYTINGIPQCTAIITAGSTLNTSVNTSEAISIIMDAHAEQDIYLDIILDIQPSLPASNRNKQPIKSVLLFRGVITSISTNTRIAPYGGSSNSVVIKAYHIYADLYKLGSNGLIYKAPFKIQRGASLSSLIKQLNTNKNDDENNTNNVQSSIVSKVLSSHVRADSAGKGAAPDSTIATITKAIVDEMYDGKLIQGTKTDVSKYIKGDTRVDRSIVSAGVATTFIKAYLDNLWYGLSRSSIGKSIFTVLMNEEYLLAIAPRSAESITIIPNDGNTMYKEHPVITTGMYSSISYNVPDDIHPKPDGILVTRSGSDHMHLGENSTGVIIGAYPSIGVQAHSKRIRRWTYVPAPSWLADNSNIQYNSKDNKNKDKSSPISDKDYKDLCDKYAKWVYDSTMNKDNMVTLSVDLRYIEAFKALGTVCEIETKARIPLKGRFFSYTFQLTQTAESSNVSINMHFSHVEKYIKELDNNIKYPNMCTLGSDDIISKIPDITAAE